MRKALLSLAAVLAVAFSSYAVADDHEKGEATQAKATIGKEAPAFSLQDQDGKTVNLSDHKGKIVVLEWFNQSCPYVVRHYEKTDTMNKTAAKYPDVVWLRINTTKGKDAAANKASADQWGIKTPILSDTTTEVAKAYGAKTTPQMFIIDKEGMLVYNGAIDDDPSADGEKGDEAVNYVAKALDEIGKGSTVTTSETKPYGCGVKYSK